MKSARGDAGVLDQKTARHVGLLHFKDFKLIYTFISLPTPAYVDTGVAMSL